MTPYFTAYVVVLAAFFGGGMQVRGWYLILLLVLASLMTWYGTLSTGAALAEVDRRVSDRAAKRARDTDR